MGSILPLVGVLKNIAQKPKESIANSEMCEVTIRGPPELILSLIGSKKGVD